MRAAHDDVIERLRLAVPGRVVTDADVLESARTDRSGTFASGRPIAVVYAESIEDVQAVCRIADETDTPLVTRGAGTGLAGGAIAGDGEIALSTERMCRVLEISAENQLCVVEPGILNGDLNRQLAERGLWWPPDPASKDISTVGGNIASNAGGLLCAKYGVTREAVLALKVVLVDGTLLEVGHRTVKGVTGYDLCALMIGSEGTLGIVVEATLKLRPAVMGVVPTIGAYFDSIADAVAAVAAVTAAGLQPAIMELMDRSMLEAVAAHTGLDLASAGTAYLLVQTDGPNALAEAQAVLVEVQAAGGRAEITTDPDAAASMVDVRRQGLPAMEALGALLIEDVAVPRDRMAEMYARIEEIAERYDVLIPTPAHAGDGNLHPTFVFEGSTSDVPDRIWDAARELFRAGLELGGTLTGEHGVGVLKRAFLGDELGDAQYEIQKRIKAVFDPKGLLNPGKVFGS
ncbi:FAD-binding protein [Pseudoclavibacter chungangensis]|uniref:FAD-binding protein n=1 Tax=Pseudoclavibacter chungangensis TaxID=587635 RepID=A0A7J5BNK6_9MICO|nr:FAD-linked oxidase C-terminal domain-containing protein [Pseudoclavibacter chungangensis]KAB1653819.1 FAD-binding protein [Pseudoclavibacter chungangensis]NYJ68171.1 glycolate oxidase [Pseudoclavibacter chungangensis]